MEVLKSKNKKSKNKKIKISEIQTLEIINDIFLTNYWCTRKNMVNITSDYLVGLDEINEWYNFFKNIKLHSINHIGYNYNYHHHHNLKRLDNLYISSYLEITAKPIYDLLNIGNGKVSLCGGAVISILKAQTPNDYDLFFHSDSVDEIEEIFNKCLCYLENIHNSDEDAYKKVTYTRSQYLMKVTFYFDDSYYDIQFIKRVYKTKEQVLFGFDLTPSRLGYNLKDGLFATICGAMAFSMNTFAIDSSKRSISFGNRLNKYCFGKDYRVLLPQLVNDLINDDSFEIFDNIYLYKNRAEILQFTINSVNNDNDDYISTKRNLDYIIKEDYEKLLFSSNDLQEIIELSDNFIEQQMNINTDEFLLPSLATNITRAKAKEFLDDRYKDFALVYFVDEDNQKADAIWKEKIEFYINLAKNAVKSIKNDENYHKGWKYLNPGQKYFGQNYPSNNPVTKYYKPLEIGISMDRFQSFMDCRKNIDYIFNLPKELFDLICEYWLKYEVEEAKNRLFNLKINQ